MELAGGFLFAQVGLGAVAGGAVIFLFALLLLPFIWIAGFTGFDTVPPEESSGPRPIAAGFLLFIALTVLWLVGIFVALEVARRGLGFFSPAVLVSSMFIAFALGRAMAGGVKGDPQTVLKFLRSWAVTFAAITVLSVGLLYVMGAGERATNEVLSVVASHVDTTDSRGSGGRYEAGDSISQTACSWGDSHTLYYQVGPNEAESFAASLESGGWDVIREVDDGATWGNRTVFRVEAVSPDGDSFASGFFDPDSARISARLSFEDGCPFELRDSYEERYLVDEFPDFESFDLPE